MARGLEVALSKPRRKFGEAWGYQAHESNNRVAWLRCSILRTACFVGEDSVGNFLGRFPDSPVCLLIG